MIWRIRVEKVTLLIQVGLAQDVSSKASTCFDTDRSLEQERYPTRLRSHVRLRIKPINVNLVVPRRI